MDDLMKKCKSATFEINGATYTIVASTPKADEMRKVHEDIPVSFASVNEQSDLDEEIHSEIHSENHSVRRQSPMKRVCENASLRLKCLQQLIGQGQVPPQEVLKKNLQYVIDVLDSISSKQEKQSVPDEPEDDLSEVRADLVPEEVRAWLASTFTKQRRGSGRRRSGEEKPRFRTVAQAIRAGIFVERIYRRMLSSSSLQFPNEITKILKLIDDWAFDVFGLNEACAGSPLRYLGTDLLNRYGVINKFKISTSTLDNFLCLIEAGYSKYRNLYHNNVHASDVAQNVHYVLCQSGLMWLTDLEIFAVIFAAIIHDVEHTGTTNNFHIMSNSDTAVLYNDKAVLENHHISAAFRMMKDEDCNILSNLTREEYREFRSLVIDMVLATDMSNHFQQIKSAKSLTSIPEESVAKSTMLSLVLHCCDIAHPSKPWHLHQRWTDLLLGEFFRQGDLEKQMGLPYSPLCDRNSTVVAESQIGFIEFIVEPSMNVMGDLLDKILLPQTRRNSFQGRGSISEESETASSELVNTAETAPTTVQKPWDLYLAENKLKWKEQSELEHI